MANDVTEKAFSDLDTAGQLDNTDIFALSKVSGNSWISAKATLTALATKIATAFNFTSALQTTDKTLTGAINEVAQGSVSADVIADEFSTESTYAVDDYVMHEGSLYKCTTAVTTAGAWDSTKWTETLVMDEVEAGGGGGGTTVIANPSGAATDELDTVQIGSTIYSLPEGGSGGGGEWIDVQGTLTAGSTSVTLSSSKIKTTSVIDVYTDTFGVNPSEMTVSAGSVTLTFPAQASDVGVMVRVSKVNTGHVYDIDLSTLQANKSWFYYDANKSSVNDTGDGLQISGNDTDNSWTTCGAIGINIANMIGTVPSGLTALKLHFKTFEMDGYTGVRFMNSNTLFSGTSGGSDAMLRTNGFYQFENNNSSIDEDNYELTVPCTAADLANSYLYIMFFDGMVAGNTSGYNNGLNGAYNIVIDGIDYVTGGNS